MLFQVTAIMMILGAAPAASGSPASCSSFLAGTWAGKGVVTEFGPPVRVDNVYTYNKDGSFLTINRFQGENKRWNEQKLSGTWKATPGRSKGECVLVLKSASAMMTSSSTSEIRMIDKDTFRSLGFDMKRVRK